MLVAIFAGFVSVFVFNVVRSRTKKQALKRAMETRARNLPVSRKRLQKMFKINPLAFNFRWQEMTFALAVSGLYFLLPIGLDIKLIGSILTLLPGAYMTFRKDQEGDRWVRKEAADLLLEDFLDKGERGHFERFAGFLLEQNYELEYVELALKHLNEWGEPRMLESAFQKSQKRNHPELMGRVTEISELHTRLEEECASLKPEALDQLLRDNHYWNAVHQALITQKPDLVREKFEVEEEKEGIFLFLVQNALALRRIETTVCTICYGRGTLSESKLLVKCGDCGRVRSILPGVNQVVGLIGGEREGLDEAGHYFVPLWNEHKKAARAERVDRIAVGPPSHPNLDWAVNACLEALQNRWQDHWPTPELTLEEGVALAPNTLALIREFVGEAPSDSTASGF